MQLTQCHELIAKSDYTLTHGRGRPWEVKAQQKFWVTSPTYKNEAGAMLDRIGKGCANSGLYLTNDQILQVFHV